MPKKEKLPKQKKPPKQAKHVKQQKKRKGRSVQDFIGVKTFTKYGLMTQKGELLFYLVSPTNISVLSYVNIEIKIRHLMMVLSSIPDIEITCTDSSECFDDNKAYLMHHRGVDRDVLYAFAHKGMIYESAEYHNAVFVGYDAQGNAAHANLRGTGSESTFKGNVPGSRPEYSFHWTGSSDKLYLFEAPIDMLSYISMHKDGWQKHSYAACCGVSDRVMLQMLQDDPNIKTVCLCLDNDEAGWKADKRIADKLFTQGIQTEILVPIHKDWNEDLLFPEESEVEDECRVLQL